MSQPFKMNGVDWQKVKVGAGVAFGGAALTVVPQFMSDVTYTVSVGGRELDLTVFVVAALSVLVNIVRKWVSENSSI